MRVDDELFERIEQARAGTPRERWIRAVVELHLHADGGPSEVEEAPDPAPGTGKAREGRPAGCQEHPGAGAVHSRGGWWCGYPGCPARARGVAQ